MRVALVSPYSWTYPGGVTRHIEALAGELARGGPRGARAGAVRPRRPPRPRSCTAARVRRRATARLARAPRGDGRLAAQRRGLEPRADARRGRPTLRRELRAGGFDVVHLHEPVAPVVGWDALSFADAPLVGTFHCYSETVLPHIVADAARRPAQAEPALRAHRRVRGRGVDRPALLRRRATGSSPTASTLPAGGVPGAAPPRGRRAAADRVRRPGRRAQGAAGPAARVRGAARARARRAARSSAPTPEEVEPLLLDGARRHRARARRRRREARGDRRAPTCCARRRWAASSFGMVLTEAFAAGTPVVASDIAGYRDVVARRRRRRARSRAATPPRWPRRCATSRSSPRAHRALGAGRGAHRRALRLAARGRARSLGAYEDARAVPAPEGRAERRAAVRLGLRAAAAVSRARPRVACPRSSRAAAGRRAAGRGRCARAAFVVAGACAGARRAAVARPQRIGLQPIAHALLASSPTWVLVALALMCASMVLRAVAWHAILRAALPDARPRSSTRCRARRSAC